MACFIKRIVVIWLHFPLGSCASQLLPEKLPPQNALLIKRSPPYRNIRYMSPERMLGSKDNILGDIWSLGIIITELVFDTPLWPSLNLAQFMRKILSLVNTKNVLEKIARESNLIDKYNELNPTFRSLLERCLSISPKDRPYPQEILEHSFSKRIWKTINTENQSQANPYCCNVH